MGEVRSWELYSVDPDWATWPYAQLWVMHMTLKLAVAAVLRALREQERRTQESLMGASDRRYVNKLEHGAYNLSLEKLRSICLDIGVSPLTFLTLTLAIADGESVSDVLARAKSELDDFESIGGLHELERQLSDGVLVTRRPGKRPDPQRLKDVLRCKGEGMTQKATAELLGIPKQTVHDLWKRDVVASPVKPQVEL